MRHVDLRQLVMTAALATASFLAACSSGDGGGLGALGDAGGDGATSGSDGGLSFTFDGGVAIDSLVVSPPTATLTSVNGALATQVFTLKGHRSDGTLVDITDTPSWLAGDVTIGDVSAGTFTATGTKGGVVTIHASALGLTGTATLTVNLLVTSNAAGVDATKAGLLRSATTPDTAITWAYPYDGTVWPRGLAGPTLMWNGAAPTDVYRFDLKSDHFEYEAFDVASAATGQYDFSAGAWDEFVDSTSGGATLTVSKLTTSATGATATLATLATQESWKVAPGSMRGTIYYWSNRQGRVLRIKPGSTTPDDFSAGVLPPSVIGPDGVTNYTCTMTCHSVSADGSTIISGGDVFGGAYDLVKNAPKFDIGGVVGGTRRNWNFSAITPKGDMILRNAGGDGAFSTVDGSHVAGTNLDGVTMWNPAFSPDGSHLLFADYSAAGVPQGKLSTFAWSGAAATARVDLVSYADVPTLPVIAYPSGSPDGKWVVYMRATGGPAISGVTGGSDSIDTRGHCVSGEPTCRYDNRADLYLASTAGGNQVALANANGTGYPFAAGARDAQLNFEPTFAPIASGGYFWVVFTSRRTYGNQAVADLPETKQLWVTAIDQVPTPGVDPSHAAFRLPGQALTFANPDGSSTNALNMRGFWALDACHADTTACSDGSECCGGYCSKAPGAATGTCGSTAGVCSGDGDHCDADSDCCSPGLSCINHFCSIDTPH